MHKPRKEVILSSVERVKKGKPCKIIGKQYSCFSLFQYFSTNYIYAIICMAFVRSIYVDLLKTLCAILVFIYPMDFNMAL